MKVLEITQKTWSRPNQLLHW